MHVLRTASPRPGARRWGLAAAVLATVLSLPASAQWVWRDGGGRVTASDRPPPREVPDKDIISRPSPGAQRRNAPPPAAAAAASGATDGAATAPGAPGAPASAPAAKGGLQAEVDARKRAADQAAADKAKAEADKVAAQRADNCKRARQHVATLESGIRITRLNDKGEREFLSDKARAEEVEQARAVASRDCN